MRVIDGKDIAAELGSLLADEVSERERTLKLGIITGNDSPVTRAYVARKEAFAQDIGVEVVQQALSTTDSTAQAIDTVTTLAQDVDGLLVQLPLAPALDTNAVLAAIPPHKDVDNLNPATRQTGKIQSPVVLAVVEILDRFVPDWQSQQIVVIGQGKLVGAPTSQTLAARGAQVAIVDKDTPEQERASALQQADIIVSGAGVPGLVQPDMIRDGVVLIDAGTATRWGSVAGDIDPACYNKASLVSPTPGGVGPVAVAKLFSNLLTIG